eukprot:TRINITY_DN109376_c0_g1_i1.p1 TRINITY_DN109376_c0_g1~~TRINITY_DN109376_c0_g1_i1.p1  ORF type:complete len:270 (-),score=40.48 TRINITY_DN109376_c0_g1_i1:190-999(-)
MDLADILGSKTFASVVTYNCAGYAALSVCLPGYKAFQMQVAVAARIVIQAPVIVAKAFFGSYLWIFILPSFTTLTLEGRVFSERPQEQCLALGVLAYTVADLVALGFIRFVLGRHPAEFAAMLAHHFFTGALCLHALYSGFMLYYGIFYIGMAELSSIPLTAMNLLRTAEEGWSSGVRGSPLQMPGLNNILRGSFAIAFLAVRVVYWIYVNLYFWKDMAQLFSRPEERRHVSMAALLFWFLGNGFLTLLQLFWARKVLKGILRAVQKKD